MSLSKALKLKLVSLGFEADVVKDGEEALSLIKKQHYDLMLLDLMMPQLDGFGVLAALKGVKNRPVIFVNSNLSQATDREKAMKLGADQYLIKSDISLKEIVEKITKALAQNKNKHIVRYLASDVFLFGKDFASSGVHKTRTLSSFNLPLFLRRGSG